MFVALTMSAAILCLVSVSDVIDKAGVRGQSIEHVVGQPFLLYINE